MLVTILTRTWLALRLKSLPPLPPLLLSVVSLVLLMVLLSLQMQATHSVLVRKAAVVVEKWREREEEEVVVPGWLHLCLLESVLLPTLMPNLLLPDARQWRGARVKASRQQGRPPATSS